MESPPPLLDNARVVEYAIFDETLGRGRRHETRPQEQRLA